jgi:hypothetical protein
VGHDAAGGDADCRIALRDLSPDVLRSAERRSTLIVFWRPCQFVELIAQELHTDVDDAELDRLQSAYKAAVDTWITAIRFEEALALVHHRVAEVDAWEKAHFLAEVARGKAEAAKAAYEAGLRSQLFGID